MVLSFLLPIASGALLAHLLWPEREMRWLVFKVFLGIGLGLGLNSLSYFLFLCLFAGQRWFMVVQALELAVAAAAVWRAERTRGQLSFRLNRPRLDRLHVALFGVAALVLVVSLLSTASYVLRRRQGDWDAWMMYNRAARFVHRDPTHWLGSFSAQMDPIFHADYPLFLAMNIAAGWDALGSEAPRVPMAQSALFAVACVGLFVSALAATRSPGQAALGLIVLWGTPAVVNEGARELADLPLAYFLLATGILLYLYILHGRTGLLVLAGMTAGFAAWTKNEGSVFVIAAGLALFLAFFRNRPWRPLAAYVAGLAVPFGVVLFFKLFLAPPSDVLSNGPARSIAQALDPARHLEILRFFGHELLVFGGWRVLAVPVGVIAVLLVYLLAARAQPERERRPLLILSAALLAVQLLGYYAVYVITPYELTWHLTYSIERVVLQVFPLTAFIILYAARTPEAIFQQS